MARHFIVRRMHWKTPAGIKLPPLNKNGVTNYAFDLVITAKK
jgi:hypothetical protein